MPKSPTVIFEDVTRENLQKAFNEPGVTMIRLGRRDKTKAQNIQFLYSARLERSQLYNIRENRKVIHRDLPKEQAMDIMARFIDKIDDPILFGVIRDIVTKDKPTVRDVIAAIAEPSE